MFNRAGIFSRGHRSCGRACHVERLEPRQLFSTISTATDSTSPRVPASVTSSAPTTVPDTGFFDGVQMNYAPEPSTTIPLLRDLGAKGVRLWGQLNHWTDRVDTLAFQRAREYHNAGFKVDLLIQCSEVP